MTLASFKSRSGGILVAVFLILYGLSFFWLGKSQEVNKTSQSVKGAKNTSSLELPVENPVPFADTQSGSVISSYVKLCSNTTYGFQVNYPKDWFATYNTEVQKCNFFAPYSYVVPQITDSDFVPIKITPVKIEDWEATVKFLETPNDFQNIISIKPTEINSRSVILVEASTTPAKSGQVGFAITSYLVFDSKTPLIFSYKQQKQQEDVENFRKSLEEMVRGLTYF